VNRKVLLKSLIFAFLLLPVFGLTLSIQAQKRDHLTEAEIEIVRDTQELDLRTKVFIKAIERRFAALGVATTGTKPAKKEKDNSDWGAAPTGTRPELLADIAKILEEAMSKIDDVYSRDPKNALIPKALKILSDAAARFQSQMNSFSGKTADVKEQEAIFQIKRDIEDIIKAQKELSEAGSSTQ
jgi:hypothetical protein